MTYKHAAVAGTFDHFHAGHKFLLSEVFQNAEKVSLALTHQDMTKEKVLSSTIQSFEVRKKHLQTYLKEQNWIDSAELFTLTDIYGTAIEDKTLDAIYTTSQTVGNAEKINKIREEKGMNPLQIVTVPLLDGDDDEPISSTRIRLGVIDREGKSYLKPFLDKDLYTAPIIVRDELRSPIGDVLTGKETDTKVAGKKAVHKIKEDEPALVIAVGDIVTTSLQEQGSEPEISFVDHRSRREDLEGVKHKAHEKHGPFPNEAGTIRSNIVRAYAGIVSETIYSKDHNQIIIEGEEDLLGLPAIMLAPLEAVVLYGQFDSGVVYVKVTEEIKRFCADMLLRFV